MTDSIERLAQNLVSEHRDGTNFHRLAIGNLADAYRVQDAYIAATIGDNAVAGYKIGLTSKRMQQLCGIDQPVRGTIFSRGVRESGARMSLSYYNHLGFELEICVRLGRDLV